jgi:hypothetical protein
VHRAHDSCMEYLSHPLLLSRLQSALPAD